MPSAAHPIPDTLSADERARMVLDSLKIIQYQRERLQHQRLTSLAKDRDPSGNIDEDGKPLSFAEMTKRLSEAEAALAKTYAEHMPAVQAMVAAAHEDAQDSLEG